MSSEIKPMDAVNTTFDNVNKLVSRIEELVERLVSMPQTVENAEATRDAPTGVLNELIYHAGRVDSRIYEANQALDALEKLI